MKQTFLKQEIRYSLESFGGKWRQTSSVPWMQGWSRASLELKRVGGFARITESACKEYESDT